MEDIDHLFLSCDFFEKFWLGIFNWLGFSMVHPEHKSYHFLQFKNLDGFPKSIRVTFQVLRLSCVWVISVKENVCNCEEAMS